MSQVPNDISEWDDCPSGKIRDLSHRFRQKSNKPVRTAAAVSVVAMLMVGAFLFVRPESKEKIVPFANITCADVAKHAKEYLAGGLDNQLRARISRHLIECPHCRPEFEKFKQQEQSQHEGRRMSPRAVAGSTPANRVTPAGSTEFRFTVVQFAELASR